MPLSRTENLQFAPAGAAETWMRGGSSLRYLIALLSRFCSSVMSERFSTHTSGRWSYVMTAPLCWMEAESANNTSASAPSAEVGALGRVLEPPVEEYCSRS